MEITKEDRIELGRLISEGYTSGRIDSTTEEGKEKFISWELKTEVWTDGQNH